MINKKNGFRRLPADRGLHRILQEKRSESEDGRDGQGRKKRKSTPQIRSMAQHHRQRYEDIQHNHPHGRYFASTDGQKACLVFPAPHDDARHSRAGYLTGKPATSVLPVTNGIVLQQRSYLHHCCKYRKSFIPSHVTFCIHSRFICLCD
jgi:hypothetical protein